MRSRKQKKKQGRKHHDGFDPKRFQAELEQFITTNACLTPREAAKFFPVRPY